MKRGDIIRQASGGDYFLWRVEETYEADSPYVVGLLVSNHKFHKSGTKKRMIRKEDYKVEPNPEAYAKGFLFSVDLTVTIKTAQWG